MRIQLRDRDTDVDKDRGNQNEMHKKENWRIRTNAQQTTKAQKRSMSDSKHIRHELKSERDCCAIDADCLITVQ